MNVDRRVLSPVPSMDSGSDGEENLRISRNLRTTVQYLDTEGGQKLKIGWPAQCQFLPDRPVHLEGLPDKIEMFYDPTGSHSFTALVKSRKLINF
jgi:hypothetical protein